ncbi:MAG: DUF885 domain-containing protein [Candidatus Longimicrobiales bacterium M2_2A_002]
MQLRTIFIVALILTVACGPTPGGETRSPDPNRVVFAPTEQQMERAAREFAELREGYLEWYFEAHPVRATELGIHAYDGRFPAMDRAGIQRRIETLLQWLADLEQIRFEFVRDDDRYDYAVLRSGIRSELLELEESRDWANDPEVYTELIGRGLVSVLERDFAPFPERAESLSDRLTAARTLLDAVPDNVRRPPRIWTEMALTDARRLLDYLETDLPAEVSDQAGDSVPATLERARALLVDRLEAHVDWLASDLLPRSTGTYRLGRYMLERRLLYSDHISLSLDELERLNTTAINDYRERIAEVAESIDPGRTPREILDSISRIGPSPDELLDRAGASVAAVRDRVVQSGVVDVPSPAVPTVRESPPYARTEFSSLDAPGPFESGDLAAYLNLTTVRPSWDEERVDQHMSYFSDAGLTVTVLHETFPGRYVQRQYARDLSELRRVLVTKSFTAGWAHYAAEMAIEEGVTDDPAVRLEQLRRALQRHARWYAVILLHALDEPLDQVVEMFEEIAYFEEYPARQEVLRATRDPSVMADALGRMQILELREDYQDYLAEQEQEFSLAEFHARLLRLGLPFPLAREVMIPREPSGPRR